MFLSALFEGYVKSRGHWFGMAHSGGSELSNCVGGLTEEGEREGEWERKQGGERRRMGVKDARDTSQTTVEGLNASWNDLIINLTLDPQSL